MNPKEESRMVWAFFIAFIAIIAVSLLFGCKTQKVVETVIERVHDTVTSVRTDTVREVRVQIIRDTTIQKEVHTYTLDNKGDTVREIHHYHDSEKVIVVDSTDRYKAVVDSLRQALHEAKSKDKMVVKTKKVVRWWEYVALLIIVGTTIFFVLRRGGKTFVDKI